MTVVYGIDPSLSRTGLAVCVTDPHIPTLVDWKVANRGSSAVGDAPWDQADRFDMLTGMITHTLTEWSALTMAPDVIVMEGPAYGSTSSGVMTHRISGYWWALATALRDWGRHFPRTPEFLVIPPPVLKKYTTGNGNAGKDEMLLAVSRLYPGAPITNNDEADAVALAAMGTRWAGGTAESVNLSAKHLAAMKTLRKAMAE